MGDEMMASLDTTSEAQKNRRAVVFYMDRGKSGKQQLNWWIKAWQFSGLDEPGEAFDIVVMVHPSGVPDIKEQCTLVTPQFSAKFNGSGKCFYKPYIGIAHREPGYDKYMNSQECLIGPGTDFLADYKILLRADMDTFPTPRFRGFWPEGVLVDSHYSTNFNLRSIKHALKKVACEAGLEHKGLYNPGSTWYGDARRVRHMAKLTVALNKFGRRACLGRAHCAGAQSAKKSTQRARGASASTLGCCCSTCRSCGEPGDHQGGVGQLAQRPL